MSEELTRVTWMPSWEPGDTKKTWLNFQQRLLAFEARQSESDLSRPTAASVFFNLERRGFEKPDAINTWKQKLGTGLRNKVTFGKGREGGSLLSVTLENKGLSLKLPSHYNEDNMTQALRHATHSAILISKVTATFVFLPVCEHTC
eukprot:1161773-Pelagomonas_calceolata.AAC.30